MDSSSSSSNHNSRRQNGGYDNDGRARRSQDEDENVPDRVAGLGEYEESATGFTMRTTDGTYHAAIDYAMRRIEGRVDPRDSVIIRVAFPAGTDRIVPRSRVIIRCTAMGRIRPRELGRYLRLPSWVLESYLDGSWPLPPDFPPPVPLAPRLVSRHEPDWCEQSETPGSSPLSVQQAAQGAAPPFHGGHFRRETRSRGNRSSLRRRRRRMQQRH